ncbi:MAG: methyltransferase domain-containing protein [Candidatus Aenigmarchaeota archaeon]|nr:methyltransferase domain-containing protein [Candidatus Aenigmarchaeota archaeon]
MYQIDDSRMPVRLGSALRVPKHAYGAWGIKGDSDELRKLSEEAYTVEWVNGSPRQMQYVSDAMRRAGYKDFPQMLRDANANEVARLVRNRKGLVNVFDVGAGLSTISIFNALDEDDKNRAWITMIEPSRERLMSAADTLQRKGFRNYTPIVGTDMQRLEEASWRSKPDVVSYVAAIHHHSDLRPPMRLAYKVLQNLGNLVIADWHNPMWEHPNRVYEFLKIKNWETKDRDLKAFASMFPDATVPAPIIRNPYEARAMRMIQDFWDGWGLIRTDAIKRGEFEPRDDIFMLEGHRTLPMQRGDALRSGFFVENERQLLEDSALLAVSTYRKV